MVYLKSDRKHKALSNWVFGEKITNKIMPKGVFRIYETQQDRMLLTPEHWTEGVWLTESRTANR